MKKYLFRDRKRRNQIILIVTIFLLVYFLVRALILSFSNEIGQARASTTSAIISGIYSSIIEKGSATVSYQTTKDKIEYPFPLNMASEICQVHQNVSENSWSPQNVHILDQESIYESQREAPKGIINFESYVQGMLTKEYILTNGVFLNSKDFDDYIEASANLNNKSQELPVRIMEGAIDYSEFDIGYGEKGEAIEVMRSYNGTPFTLEQLNDVSFLVRNFYIVAPATRITDELFDAKTLLAKDMTIQTANNQPQILIYHTHSQEAFLDSRKGVLEDSVVGIGDLLTEILEEKYGYNVIHDRGVYDLVDGRLDRNKAYNYARDAVIKILDENPSIDVVIDLHRDGIGKRSTIIDGQETAQIMLFNGLSRDKNGPISRLDNPNLQDNLAFSLQLQLKSLEMYPGFFYKNYLQYLRYNLDIRPKSLLIELGTDKNTLRSAKKAMGPFAEILDAVLKGQ
jgi:stage II sporulation protein P